MKQVQPGAGQVIQTHFFQKKIKNKEEIIQTKRTFISMKKSPKLRFMKIPRGQVQHPSKASSDSSSVTMT